MDHKVYARLEVEALDVTPTRKRWIEAMAPNVGLRVADLFTLPSKAWDLVVCSHVVEHIDEPRPFIEKLQDVCRGFAFVYSPYNENPRIRPHKSTITKADYAGLPCELHLIKSMGWHPNKPDDLCLLAVIDCRPQQRRIPAAPVRVDDPEGRRTLPEPGQDATPPSPDLSENPDSGVS
jgi:SAM-dependent methyltransferase